MLDKGLKKLGDARVKGTKKIGQLYDRGCFRPVWVTEMTQDKKKDTSSVGVLN